METLPLDPRSYRGTYKLIGGRLSLDLVNTVSWPGTRREHDWFDPPENITLWAAAAGLVDDRARRRLDQHWFRHRPSQNTGPDPRPDGHGKSQGAHPTGLADQVSAVRAIRQTLRHALAPWARGESPSRRAIRDLNQVLATAGERRLVDPESLAWTWDEPTTLEELMAPVIHDAAEVLTSVDPRRIRHCPSCDWLFHDTTRNASRRWCDMADCGSRDKALRYYHRRKPTP